MQPIYLDNNSTTRMAPEVIDAMTPFWREQFGNPSSLHSVGQAARHAIETAREQVAAALGASSREIIFTSGGTEANNLAIMGTLAAHPAKRHIVTTAVEHHAVLSPCERLAKQGYRLTVVGVDRQGRLDLDAFAAALSDETALACVLYANNETGVIFPVREAAEIAAARGVPLFVDAVQAFGKVPFDVKSLGAPLVSISAHKIHGPKGVGALYVGRGARLRSVQVGGSQERELRPGTENITGIIGLGAAATLAKARLAEGWDRVAAMRDRLERGLCERVDFAHVSGGESPRIPNTTNIGFERLEAEAILIALSESGVCISSGAACASGALEASHVIKAMGIEEKIAHGAVRFSLSHETSEDEIDRALEIVPKVVKRLATLTTT